MVTSGIDFRDLHDALRMRAAITHDHRVRFLRIFGVAYSSVDTVSSDFLVSAEQVRVASIPYVPRFDSFGSSIATGSCALDGRSPLHTCQFG